LAIGHAGVGALIYRRELRRFGARPLLGAASFRGREAPAFWFFVNTPLLLIVGGLLHRAEDNGDTAALRNTSGFGLAASLPAAFFLPRSGFWVWAIVSLRGLRDAHRLSRRHRA